MTAQPHLIQTSTLPRDALKGQTVIVTGAGGGIGFEGVRALAHLGAQVIIAERDRKLGRVAEDRINAAFGRQVCAFVETDVGDERSVARLARRVLRMHGRVDAVINNATVAPVGAVADVPIAEWDTSYHVNLRGPVLMARAFLPGMLARDSGVFLCVSSVGDKFMGPYESLKTAQVHLGNTLAAELEGTGVIAFTLGPGLILTDTARSQIARLAPLYGQTVDEFYAMSREHMLSAEAAGTGYAAAIALAPRFRGQEISATAALIAAGIDTGSQPGQPELSTAERERALQLCHDLHAALAGQAEGWAQRSMFERQWMQRDFQKYAGQPVDQVLAQLEQLTTALASDAPGWLPGVDLPAPLARYFEHYLEMARGYIKDPAVLAAQVAVIGGWIATARALDALLSNVTSSSSAPES